MALIQKVKWPDLAQRRDELAAELAAAEAQDISAQHELLLKLGRIEYLTGDLNLAKTYFQRVLEESQDDQQKAAGQLGMAWSTYLTSDWPGASEFIQEGLDLVSEPQLKARLLALRGLILYRQGDYSRAIRDSETALELSSDDYASGLAHNTIATVLHATQKNQEALAHWETAEALAAKQRSAELMVRLLNSRGTYYYNQKAYEAAHQHFTDAIEIARTVSLNALAGYPLLNLAGVYMIQNDVRRGVEFLNQAEGYFQQVGDKFMLSAIHYELGNSYRVQKDHRRALIHINRAIELARECGNQRNLVFSYREMGLLHRDQRSWNEALMDFKLARELAILLNDQVLQIEIDRLLKETYDLKEGTV